MEKNSLDYKLLNYTMAFRFAEIDKVNIWYDIEKKDIESNLDDTCLYDAYILTKRGKIKIRKSCNKLKIMALRFRYYKKYMVIVQITEKLVILADPVE